MRLAFGISLILLGVLWLAATTGLREPAESEAAHWKNAQAGTQWRRTAHGWQRADAVLPGNADGRQPISPTKLSPLLVAALQLLLSVLALIVFPVAAKPPAEQTESAVPLSVTKRRFCQKTVSGVTR